MKETRKRTLAKTILWRIIATLNSFLVLLAFHNLINYDTSDLTKAVAMNITGFFVYYAFERICTCIKWGVIEN